MFYDPSVLSFFGVRGWITMSKDYTLRKMLLCLLQDAIGVKGELDKVSDGDLADRLQKSLKSRRYLIVVDDIWSTEAWDDIRLCFPENNNRSRILLTTRDMNVAQYASSPKDPFPMRFLEPEESWNLFCQKAFGKKDCPNEFDNVAKVVVESCKGLPLMISVVAGLLSSKTLDEWMKVAQSMSLLVNLDDYQHCSRVLALSYKHLPSHLKTCFLYFGVFPKAREISVKKLIRLWVAEGLIELKGLEGLEKVAANLLHDLIDKNLLVVSRRNLTGSIKACRIHDLLHDLCLREAEGERLLYSYVIYRESFGPEFPPEGCHWMSVCSDGTYRHIHFDDVTHKKTRSLHFSADELWPDLLFSLGHFKLLRVLDLEAVGFSYFPSEILHLVGLRYLALTAYNVPEDLALADFWNLETLIVSQPRLALKRSVSLPIGIWQVYQLRYLRCTSMFLYPPRNISAKHPILENLLNVSGLNPSCCTKEIFERIRNVKKSGVLGGADEFFDEPEWLDNLKHLHELEALKIAAGGYGLLCSGFRLPCADSFHKISKS
ncbi:putative late blight resistance protein homolog R1A-10 [Solanum tuberosum]|uniref:Disease resistance protein n=1 Tax=Solanum tuberosum TaxID=4113 RepID=M1A0R5_SOLTU|nr:PREDICTED: putative late blight resistance protein homolog R1A-10 [Solanum tuberosum]